MGRAEENYKRTEEVCSCDRRKIRKRQTEDGKGQRRFGDDPKNVQKGSKEVWERDRRKIGREVCE